MATASSSSVTEEEEDNFLHIYKLVVGVGTDVVRDTFDRLFPPCNLAATLKNEDIKIRSLGKKKRLTAHQIDILLPLSGTTSSQRYDISLMICLIRNLISVKRPVNGFDQLPLSIETYMEADLARIKFYRNEVAHAESDKITNTEFKLKWKDLVDGIIRLGGIQYKNVCDELEHAKLSKNCISDLRQGIAILQEEARYNLQQFQQDNIQLKTKVIGLEDELYRKLSYLKKEQDVSNLQNRDKINELNTILQKIKTHLYFEPHVVNESNNLGETKASLVLNKEQKYDYQELYTCTMSILESKNIRLSNPTSPSIETNAEPEFTASDKVALLIGNVDCRCDSSLSAAIADVYKMTDIFRSLNFKVFSLVNLTKVEMQSAVFEFIQLIGSEVYAVFYFCGHGFEEDAKCYLIPPNARKGFTKEDCLCAEDVLNQMQYDIDTPPALIVLILDINRVSNPEKIQNQDQIAPTAAKTNNIPMKGNTIFCYATNSEKIQNQDQIAPTAAKTNNIPMKGNTVLCYATSKGMYAYEDSYNGILLKYLKKYLPTHMSVLDVFTCVQEDIGKEPLYKHIQIPEIKSNLSQPRRSLADRISMKGHTEDFNRRTLLWNSFYEKPSPKEIEFPDINGKVLIDFHAEFSNMLTIFVTVIPMTMGESLNDYLGCINHLPKTISVLGNVSQIGCDPTKTKIVLQDLQKLTKNLEVLVCVVNIKTRQRYVGPKINLGKPLVGLLDLWKPRRHPIECSDESM